MSRNTYGPAFLTLLTLSAAYGLLSCGETASASPEVTETKVVTSETAEIDSLLPASEKDFGEKEYRVIAPLPVNESMNGSRVNDAKYSCDRMTEETLNIKISYISTDNNNELVEQKVRESVMAGDNDYELIINHTNAGLNAYVSDNLVYDWKSIPGVDLSKPYWNQDVFRSLSVGGKSPYGASDYCSLGNNVFLLSNKTLAKDLDMGTFYEYVYNGTWTWDKIAEISAAAKQDLNGDGLMTADDRYGLVVSCVPSAYKLRSIPASCGLRIYGNDPEEGVYLSVNDERARNLLEKTVALFNGGGGLLLTKFNTDSNVTNYFANGNYLFFMITDATAYTNLDFDYGILPLPKYDETQQNYTTASWGSIMLVPNTANAELSGLGAEWLSYYYYKIARPEFFDSYLSARFAQDKESVDMLGIIYDNLIYDPGMNFLSARFYGYFDSLVSMNSKNFDSYFKQNEKSELAYIAALNESFSEFGK